MDAASAQAARLLAVANREAVDLDRDRVGRVVEHPHEMVAVHDGGVRAVALDGDVRPQGEGLCDGQHVGAGGERDGARLGGERVGGGDRRAQRAAAGGAGALCVGDGGDGEAPGAHVAHVEQARREAADEGGQIQESGP